MPFLGDAHSASEFGGVGLVMVCLSLLAAVLAVLRYRHLYRKAREEHQNHRDLIENLTEGIYRSSPDGKQLSANRALVKLNGYESEAEMLAGIEDIGREWYVDPARRDEFRAILRCEGRVENFVSEIFRHKTRERIWITESARIVYDRKTAQPLFYEGSVKEITETFTRLNLEEMFQKLTSQVPGGLFQFIRHRGGAYTVPYVSSGFRRISTVEDGDEFFSPQDFLKRIHPDDHERYTESLRRSGVEMVPWECEFRRAMPGGQEKWLRVTATPEAVAEGIMWHGYLADISVRKKHEMEIERLAFRDPLTDLPNRRMYLKRMIETLEACVRSGNRGALLFVDLDNFKVLNDTMGHATGDAFLKQVAGRLRQCVGAGDMVARIGGDEFVVLLPDAGDSDATASRGTILVAGQVLSALRQPFRLADHVHCTSASIGAVVFDGTHNVDDIMKNADAAMYQAKTAGRNGLALFDAAAVPQQPVQGLVDDASMQDAMRKLA